MAKDKCTAAESYAISLDRNEPAHYTQIPNALFYATYLTTEDEKINGKKTGNTITVRKKLSARFRDFYHFIKMVAVTGACWMDSEEMAEQIGCSTGTISALKEEGLKPIEQFNNKPLLTIKTIMKRKEGSNILTPHHTIKINPIWGLANAFMEIRKDIEPDTYKLGVVHNSIPLSNIESDGVPLSNIERGWERPLSNIEGNNRNTEQDEICYNSNRKSESQNDPDENICYENTIHDEILEKKIVDSMRNLGCDNNFIREMIKKYPHYKIADSMDYVIQQVKRGKVIKNVPAYLRNIILKGVSWVDYNIKSA